MPEAGEGEGEDCEDNAEQRAGGGGDDLAHDVGDAGDEAGDRSGDVKSRKVYGQGVQTDVEIVENGDGGRYDKHRSEYAAAYRYYARSAGSGPLPLLYFLHHPVGEVLG